MLPARSALAGRRHFHARPFDIANRAFLSRCCKPMASNASWTSARSRVRAIIRNSTPPRWPAALHAASRICAHASAGRSAARAQGFSNTGWRNESFRGYADYMQTEAFQDAFAALIRMSRQKRVAIMCAEAVPWRCHRSLVADALSVRGVPVIEILSESSYRPHKLTPFAQVEGRKLPIRPSKLRYCSGSCFLNW